MLKLILSFLLLAGLALGACNNAKKDAKAESDPAAAAEIVAKYKTVQLSADLSHLADHEREVVKLLIEAAKEMDKIFWMQSYPAHDSLLKSIQNDTVRRAVEINYGPYDRLAGLAPFIPGVGPKPKGAGFYPDDMTEEEFEQFADDKKDNLYTLVRRDDKGGLKTVPYHVAYKAQHEKAAKLLEQASAIAKDPGLKKYLTLRAQALRDDNYADSDIAWLQMETNGVDVIIGPIENYEDRLFNYKAAHEAYVLVKDKEWTEKLEYYGQFLPELQANLPTGPEYKPEMPGRGGQLGAFDVVYYAGDCNAGSKTIAVNLPNDPKLQTNHGTRRSQLKNAMRAKYDEILAPLSQVLMHPEQRKHITFDAFFSNTMFHEVAHGLGIKYVVGRDDSLEVKASLKEHSSAIEEGKADILGIHMVTELFDKGEIKKGALMDYYVTFVASIFRSVRFGASSAHGQANMLRFNYFLENGAVTRDQASNTYRVHPDKMREVIRSLSDKILRMQGDGDYAGASAWLAKDGKIPAALQADLDRLEAEHIPVDVVFEQGPAVLGLK